MSQTPRRKQILLLTVIAFLLGLMIMVSIHTNQAAAIKQENNTQELVNYIEDLEKENAGLEEQIQTVRTELSQLETSQDAEETQLASMNELLADLSVNAQLTNLSGPGLVITLNDNSAGAELAQKNNPAAYAAENYLIHDKDILYMVRALAAGAEACSINGFRITDSTSIRCAGTIILVNANRLAPPYEITVIGSIAELTRLLEDCGTYKSLIYRGLPVKYESRELVQVPAYAGAYSISYGRVAVPDADENNSAQ